MTDGLGSAAILLAAEVKGVAITESAILISTVDHSASAKTDGADNAAPLRTSPAAVARLTLENHATTTGSASETRRTSRRVNARAGTDGLEIAVMNRPAAEVKGARTEECVQF